METIHLTVRGREHEAALSLAAWTGGVRTPRLVGAGEVGTDSMLLARPAPPSLTGYRQSMVAAEKSLRPPGPSMAMSDANWSRVRTGCGILI